MCESSKELCRLCYASNEVKTNICNGKIPGFDIQEVILHLFRFKVQPTDQVSTSICNNCLQYIKEFYNFCLKVKQVQVNFIYNFNKINSKGHTVDCSTMVQYPASTYFITPMMSTNASECFQTVIKKEDPLENKTGINSLEKTNSLDSGVTVKEEPTYEVPIEVNDTPPVKLKSELIGDCIQNQTEDLIPVAEKDVEGSSSDNCSISLNTAVPENDSGDEMSLEGFPEYICKDGRLVVTRSDLDILLSRFFKIHCEICKSKPKFPTLYFLFMHYDTDHNTRGYVTCCRKQLKKRSNAVDHMISHLWPNSYQCENCKRVFPSHKCLTMHMKRHLPNSERKYKCDKCEKGYISLFGLKTHKITHIPPEEIETFNCKECSKSFKGNFSLENHIRNSHRYKTFLCPTCGKKCRTRSALKIHLTTHDPGSRELFSCEECGIRLNSDQMRLHKKKHRSERIQCTLCNYNTYHERGLKNHMKFKHSQERPFACQHCEKSFKLKATLKDHMAQHTGQHRYSCQFCSRTFATSGNFYSHRKRMHAEQLKNKFQNLHSNIMQEDSEEKNMQMENTAT